MLRDILLAFVRVHVLHHAAEEGVYGLAMIEELRHHGYAISPGTLYPILHGMESAGYLRASDAVVDGRRRKLYRATAKGRRLLATARARIRELGGEILP